MSIEPKDLAKTVKATRDEFDAAFIAAQREINASPPIKAFKTIARNMVSDTEAFEAAFSVARHQGWLPYLVWTCSIQGLGTIDLIRASEFLAEEREVAPVQNLPGPIVIDGSLLGRHFPQLRAVTCFIDVDNGASTGTGFLIGPDLIITAWHVVKSLFVPGRPAQPARDGSTRLDVLFDMSPISKSVEVKVAEDWHVVSSPCHSDELNGLLPADLGQLKDHYDFAIIRLDDDPGRRRGWLRMERDVGPRRDETISIVQHPLRNSLMFGAGAFDTFVDDPPRTRFLHRVGTAFGSSGGPCVNSRFQLVGLHQAGFKGNAKNLNRAIVAARLWQAIGSCPTSRPLWKLPNSVPVLARSHLQQTIGYMAIETSKRILIIRGEPNTGKTFSLDILEASLPNAQHVILRLDAVELPPSAADLARVMLAKAGNQSPQLPAEDDPGTTLDAYIKLRLIPALNEQMEEALDGRLFWLAIDSLDKLKTPMGSARRLLDMLNQNIGSHPWLRIVLVGFRETMSYSSRSFVAGDATEAPTLQDIEIYLRQRVAAANSSIRASELQAIAREVDRLARARRGPYIAALAAVLRDEGETLLAVFAKGTPGG